MVISTDEDFCLNTESWDFGCRYTFTGDVFPVILSAVMKILLKRVSIVLYKEVTSFIIVLLTLNRACDFYLVHIPIHHLSKARL